MDKKSVKILLVEDDPNLGIIMEETLESEGYKVTLANDGLDGLKAFNQKKFDLCLLDVMLPEKDGFSLAKDIRHINPTVPIIFVTAKSQDKDKISGLEIGADDYITKPFNTEEALLRIEAVLRRSFNVGSGPIQQEYKLGEYTFDFTNYKLIHPKEETKLTKRECKILKLLYDNKNQIIDRSLILNHIWGTDDYFKGRSLDVFITKLRKYLSHDSSIGITNIHGVGFKLETNDK